MTESALELKAMARLLCSVDLGQFNRDGLAALAQSAGWARERWETTRAMLCLSDGWRLEVQFRSPSAPDEVSFLVTPVFEWSDWQDDAESADRYQRQRADFDRAYDRARAELIIELGDPESEGEMSCLERYLFASWFCGAWRLVLAQNETVNNDGEVVFQVGLFQYPNEK